MWFKSQGWAEKSESWDLNQVVLKNDQSWDLKSRDVIKVEAEKSEGWDFKSDNFFFWNFSFFLFF